MHYEHVLQILHGSFHPVVERSRPLGKLQEQLINSFQQLLCPLRGLQDNTYLLYIFLPITSNLQLSVRLYPEPRSHHLHISHTNPKTNIPSPVLITNPRVHNTDMALLTPYSGLVVPESLSGMGEQGVEDGQKTDPCPCHSDLILGSFPRPSHICRSGMASMDQRKWLVGF